MRGVVCAVAIGITQSGDLVLDPADGECVRAGCFAFFFSETEAPEGEVVWADWQGATSKEEVCRHAPLALFTLMVLFFTVCKRHIPRSSRRKESA